MRLWDFALAAWSRPGVESACLELQDDHGQCVALLLWRAWADTESRAIDAGALSDTVSLARAWETEVVAPVRSARRALPRLGDVGAPVHQAVRAAELSVERALLSALEAATPAETAAPGAILTGLMEVAHQWNGAAPEAETAALVRALR